MGHTSQSALGSLAQVHFRRWGLLKINLTGNRDVTWEDDNIGKTNVTAGKQPLAGWTPQGWGQKATPCSGSQTGGIQRGGGTHHL